MATITLKYNEKNAVAKSILDMIKTVGVFEIENAEEPIADGKKHKSDDEVAFLNKMEKARKSGTVNPEDVLTTLDSIISAK